MPTSTGKDWKIILLINGNLQKWKELIKPTTPIHSNENSLVEAPSNSLKELTCNCSLLLTNWDALQMHYTPLFIGKAYNMNA